MLISHPVIKKGKKGQFACKENNIFNWDISINESYKYPNKRIQRISSR